MVITQWRIQGGRIGRGPPFCLLKKKYHTCLSALMLPTYPYHLIISLDVAGAQSFRANREEGLGKWKIVPPPLSKILDPPLDICVVS